MIKKIRVKNFKSFKDLELNLGKVNILIGANASGKSNFVQIFEFLKDIARDGLDKAISKDGKYLKNIDSDELLIEVTFNPFPANLIPSGLIGEESKYTILIKFKEDGSGIEKVEDKIILGYILDIGEKSDSGIMIFSNDNGMLDAQIISSIHAEIPQETSEYFKLYQNVIDTMKLRKDSLLLESPLSPMLFAKPYNPFKEILTYDLDPQLSKKAVPIFSWGRELERNGENLFNVVKNILIDPEKKRMFMNLVSDLLPYIEDIEVDKFEETHFYLKIKETYSDKHYLPAHLSSDGTINALGLIVALYFQESPLIIIEEPDRGFHPSLISKVVDMMKDASRKKQIIVTTHNSEMVRHADIEDIKLVSRDKEGFSHISNPMDKEETKIFLENEMGLAELFVDNLLEI
jgi:predicted ATPase